MTNKLKINVTGLPARELISARTKKPFTLTDIYVMGSAPFPEKISVFDKVELTAGWYEVPFSVSVNNERLGLSLDFRNAVKLESK